MNSMHQTGSFVKDHAEPCLHFDELRAIAFEGDTEFDSAAQWDDAFDNWYYGCPEDIVQPYPAADLQWAAETLNQAARDFHVPGSPQGHRILIPGKSRAFAIMTPPDRPIPGPT
jgi:hypothetical protein